VPLAAKNQDYFFDVGIKGVPPSKKENGVKSVPPAAKHHDFFDFGSKGGPPAAKNHVFG